MQQLNYGLSYIEDLTVMNLESESLRKSFSDRLSLSASRLEEFRNQIFNQEMNVKMTKHAIQFMQEQFLLLYNSI